MTYELQETLLLLLALQTSINLLVGVGWGRRLLGLLLLAVALWLSITDGKVLHIEAMEASNPNAAQSLSGPKARWKRTQFINFCVVTPLLLLALVLSHVCAGILSDCFLEFRLVYLAIFGPE